MTLKLNWFKIECIILAEQAAKANTVSIRYKVLDIQIRHLTSLQN